MSHIVIVDDSEEILSVMKYFLELRDYSVTTVDSAAELNTIIQSVTPDLILLDIFLNGQDGREVCRQLRRNSATKYLCILMFSASSEALGNYKEYGADGFIEKPFGLDEVVHKIEQSIEHCKNYHPQ